MGFLAERPLQFLIDFLGSIAQLDRAADFESAGRGFDSLWTHYFFKRTKMDNASIGFLTLFVFIPAAEMVLGLVTAFIINSKDGSCDRPAI